MEPWTKYFEVVGIVPGKVIFPLLGPVDFSNPANTVEQMKRLYEADCPYLKLTPSGEKELYGIGAKPSPQHKPAPKAATAPQPIPASGPEPAALFSDINPNPTPPLEGAGGRSNQEYPDPDSSDDHGESPAPETRNWRSKKKRNNSD